MRPVLPAALLTAALALAPRPAAAIGELVTDIQVRGNTRTDEDTIRAIAGISIGDTLETETLTDVRERLGNSGMFADTNVYWEPHGEGARIVVNVREKFPWAPVPTFSLSQGVWSFGALLVHGNLFGRGKQGVIGGRISNVNSGAVLVYRDPAVLGSWLYFQIETSFNERDIPEYSANGNDRGILLRNTTVQSYGFAGNLGIFWWRRVRTEGRFSLQQYDFRNPEFPHKLVFDAAGSPSLDSSVLRGYGQAQVTFDFRAREHAIMRGNALSVSFEAGNHTFFSDRNVDYWKAVVRYEHGIRFFRRHNWLIKGGGDVGKNLPLTEELSAGGTFLRGFLYEQFRGDTRFFATTEYHVPIVSIGALDIRAVAFYDLQALWFRSLPSGWGMGTSAAGRGDAGRSYLDPMFTHSGFQFHDLHQGIGGGLRFFLRSVAVPLVGLDYGYGVEDRDWRMTLVIGG